MTDTKVADRSVVDGGRTAVVALGPVLVVWIGLMVAPIPFAIGEAFLALGSVVVPVLVTSMSMGPGWTYRWARQRGAHFEPDVLPTLSLHLVRTRVARTLGVTLGIGISAMLLARYNADPESFPWYVDHWSGESWLWLSALGYVVASVVTELAKPRLDDATASRAAVLASRRLVDYLDPFIARALVLTAGLGLALAGVGALIVMLGARGWWISGARVHTALLAVVGLLALGAAVAVAHRRNTAAGNVALAYEELTRTATINALAGTAAAMFLLHGSEVIRLVVGPTGSIIPGLLGLVAWLVGLSLWASSGTSLVFRSRRLERIRGGS